MSGERNRLYTLAEDVTGRDLDLDTMQWVDTLVANAGETVYRFFGATYGCISHEGVAVSRFGPFVNPFFEVPWSVLALAEGGSL